MKRKKSCENWAIWTIPQYNKWYDLVINEIVGAAVENLKWTNSKNNVNYYMMLCQKGWIKSKTRYKLSKNLVSGSPGPRGVAKEFTGFFFSFFSRERERERERCLLWDQCDEGRAGAGVAATFRRGASFHPSVLCFCCCCCCCCCRTAGSLSLSCMVTGFFIGF